MSKISTKFHLVVELEHRKDFLCFRVGSETDRTQVENIELSVNDRNGLLNYQK